MMCHASPELWQAGNGVAHVQRGVVLRGVGHPHCRASDVEVRADGRQRREADLQCSKCSQLLVTA
jgi:hypothetical protein